MAPQRMFLTGGSGYVGSVVIELAISEGKYTVYALSRNETSDEKLRKLGAVPVRGDLSSHEVLGRESAAADVVINLATAYAFGQGTYADALPIDNAAVDVMAQALAGSGKPLIVTNGTLAAQADANGGETDETAPPDPTPLNIRIKAEQHALALAAQKDVRVMAIRLAPYTYGRGGSGVAQFMGMAKQMKGMTTVDGGRNHTTCVHVDDAARLFLLAAEKGKAGNVYNASSNTQLTVSQIFGAIAGAVHVPVQDISYEDALGRFGENIAWFLRAQNRASGAKAVKELGWQPTGKGLLDEITSGSYVPVAAALNEKSD